MNARNEWEEFFDGHAPAYMENVFTKNTLAEVDFIIEELKLPQGCRILDVGCGTGRHSVELATRGYAVTGVDISSGMLAQAREAAKKAGVEVEWIHFDATQFKPERSYDAAICLCEGAFGLLGKNDDPLEQGLSILRNISRALKPDSKLMMTVLNGLALVRKYKQEDVEKGVFNPVTLAETYPMEYDTPGGKKSMMVRERGFTPTELKLMLGQTGFEVYNIWGGTAGNWGRRKIDLDEIEIMIIANKEAQTA
jgi:cyclopropane fatty-acyl-phospholipid synthase-like methyltransferase